MINSKLKIATGVVDGVAEYGPVVWVSGWDLSQQEANGKIFRCVNHLGLGEDRRFVVDIVNCDGDKSFGVELIGAETTVQGHDFQLVLGGARIGAVGVQGSAVGDANDAGSGVDDELVQATALDAVGDQVVGWRSIQIEGFHLDDGGSGCGIFRDDTCVRLALENRLEVVDIVDVDQDGNVGP